MLPNWRQVDKDEFFAAFEKLDAISTIVNGKYPYITHFKLRNGHHPIAILEEYYDPPGHRGLTKMRHWLPPK